MRDRVKLLFKKANRRISNIEPQPATSPSVMSLSVVGSRSNDSGSNDSAESKVGIARAAQALAPRVPYSF